MGLNRTDRWTLCYTRHQTQITNPQSGNFRTTALTKQSKTLQSWFPDKKNGGGGGLKGETLSRERTFLKSSGCNQLSSQPLLLSPTGEPQHCWCFVGSCRAVGWVWTRVRTQATILACATRARPSHFRMAVPGTRE